MKEANMSQSNVLRFSLLSLAITCSLVISVHSRSPSSSCPPHQRHALSRFNHSLLISRSEDGICRDTSYPKTASWREDVDCCSWEGVACDNSTGDIVGLDLSCAWLRGAIHSNSSLFSLRHLRSLSLARNDLMGSSIPVETSVFSQMTHLDLSTSNLSGIIPTEISRLSKLVSLDLSGNALEMQNPTMKMLVTNLTQLERLQLSYINMSAVIPTSMMNFTSSLISLQLRHCLMGGKFPDNIFQLPSLQELVLSLNSDLHGTLPESNWSSSLAYLALADSSFAGGVPSSIGGLQGLSTLDLSSNNFTGEIPSSIGGLQGLIYLDLSRNNFAGGVPSSIGGLPRLNHLYLSNNNFTNFVGRWPGDIFLRSTSLQFVDLSTNRFEGPLPLPSYATYHYSVSNNNFSGEVSSLLCNATNLQLLDLSNNGLTGTLPQCLKNITIQLSLLNLRANGFQGSIPEIFHEQCGLTSLDFSRNQFEGTLPTSLSNCSWLEALDVGSNKIVDSFPNWLADLPLKVLNLRSNKLQGRVSFPKGTHPFSSIRILDISNNGLDGSLPDNLITETFGLTQMVNDTDSYMGDFYNPYSVMINLKGNEIEMVKINVQFAALDLSSNRFWGEIPRNIGLLKALKGLNFSHNSFTGTIPQSIGNLTNLESLDLSSNNLDGEIPRELVQLTSLGALNLSRNNLTGPIPSGGHFNTFSNSSFEGNPGLCGTPLTRSCGQGRVEAQPRLERRDDGKDELGGWMDWKFVAMGFGSGVGIGISLGYMVLEMGRPLWLAWMVIQLESRCRKRSKKRKATKRNGTR